MRDQSAAALPGVTVPAVSDGLVRLLTSDWQISSIVSARSGTHFSATTGVDIALNGQANQRPNKVTDDVYIKEGYRWLNPTAFRNPATASSAIWRTTAWRDLAVSTSTSD